MSQLDADEEFARQLQAQEMGLRSLPQDHNQRTPLIRDREENPTVLNARLNELSSARATVLAIFIVHFPQIIAGMVLLPIHWDDTSPCDAVHRNRWKWWGLVSTARMSVYTAVVCYMHVYRQWLEPRTSLQSNLTNIRNFADGMGLVWFVVGNMWIFGDDSCKAPLQSPLYILDMTMLILNYVQICLPCIVAVMLIPVFCFCMPCLIRILARIQESQQPKGATDDAIDAIPLVTVEADTLRHADGDSTCPICLSDMALGEKVRVMPCKHVFHTQCVDEWLRVNASCPTCRASIFQNTGVTDSAASPGSGAPSISAASNHRNVSTSAAEREGTAAAARGMGQSLNRNSDDATETTGMMEEEKTIGGGAVGADGRRFTTSGSRRQHQGIDVYASEFEV